MNLSSETKRLLLCLTTSVSGMVSMAAPAATQDTSASQVEEVVVTAQRRTERLQDTPIAITALTTQALEDRGITNLRQISSYTPNVELTTTSRPTGGGSAFAAFFRGVGSGDYTFPTDPTIGLYVDGVYMARPLGGLLSIADMTRVEVLRGPQGTLYGRNNLGGAISLITAKPNLTGATSGDVLLRAGNYGRLDATATLNAPLVEDRVGFKLSVANFTSDGYTDLQQYAKTNAFDENRFIARTGLLFAVTDNLSIDVRGDYSRQKQTGAASSNIAFTAVAPANVVRFNQLVAPLQNAQFGIPAGSTYGPQFLSPEPFRTYAGGPIHDNYEAKGASATIEYTPSASLNFRSITAYRKLDTDVAVDSDGSPYLISVIDEFTGDKTLSQELHLFGTVLSSRLQYLVGAYYFREQGDVRRDSQSFHGLYQVTGLAADARDTTTFLEYDAKSIAGFAQLEYSLTDRLSVVGGGRYTKDDKEFGVFVTLPERDNAVSVPRQSRSDTFDAFTPKVGVNFRVSSDVLVYGSFSGGFKSGGFTSPTATVASASYDPETIDSYELGMKAQWFDRRLTTNIAAFYSEWQDLQLSVLVPGPTGTNIGVTQNGGDAELYGFEAEITGRVTDGLSLSLAVGYTHTELVRLTAGAITNGFTLATNLPHVPKWTINPAIDYGFSSGIGRFDSRLSLSHRSEQFLTVNDPGSYQPSYSLLNARIAFTPAASPNFELSVEGNNLTDETYFAYNQALATTGGRTAITGEPRSVAVSARYRF